jgi:hypothetical protein
MKMYTVEWVGVMFGNQLFAHGSSKGGTNIHNGDPHAICIHVDVELISANQEGRRKAIIRRCKTYRG